MNIKDIIVKRSEIARKLRPLPPSPARTKLAKILTLPNSDLIERFIDTYLQRYGVNIYESKLLPAGLVMFGDNKDFFHCLTDILKLTVQEGIMKMSAEIALEITAEKTFFDELNQPEPSFVLRFIEPEDIDYYGDINLYSVKPKEAGVRSNLQLPSNLCYKCSIDHPRAKSMIQDVGKRSTQGMRVAEIFAHNVKIANVLGLAIPPL